MEGAAVINLLASNNIWVTDWECSLRFLLLTFPFYRVKNQGLYYFCYFFFSVEALLIQISASECPFIFNGAATLDTDSWNP